ncbi:hypothetical protein PQR39_35370 [Paraburkholderia sediminicola]|uniref:hypothetical protein n=1 Tax=Paraburkholderia sediminicola TaxID=458836 RepID=UPI0038B8981C
MSTVFIGKEYDYHVKLLQLITEAHADGIVLTIDAEPRHPLATGHFDMRPAARYSRAAKETKLWMLHIEGPDDIVAAPSFMEAWKVREEFNAYWRAYSAMRVRQGANPDHLPTTRAVVMEWDGTPKDHTANVAEYWAGYLGYDEALKDLRGMK